VLVATVLDLIPLGQAASSTFAHLWSTISHHSLQQDDSQESASQNPSRKYVQRIKLLMLDTQELTFDEAIVALTVLDPSVAAAENKNARQVVITGLGVGETILIISGKNSRSTFVIQVVRPMRVMKRPNNAARPSEPAESFSGFYGLYFSPGTGSAPSLLRHSFEFNQKLSGARSLRASGELFNFFGRGARGLAQPLDANFGMNRIELGIDAPGSSFDLLDSELAISRLSFNNYTIRGPHFLLKSDTRLKGLEIFAGRARPQVSFFDEGEGLLVGMLVPLAQSGPWRIRAGAFFVSPHRQGTVRESGIVWHADARYTTDERTIAEAEMAYSNGGISWRARLDLRRGPFNFYGELFRLDQGSTLISVGAQSSGRRMNLFGLQWRPRPHFSASLNYNSTSNFPISTSRRIELNSRTFNISANYVPARGTRLGFSFNQQEVKTPGTLNLPFLLSLRTRAGTFRYGQRIGSHWTNDFEARFILSSEGVTSEQVARGLNVHEQLRVSWRGGSLAGFVNYRSNTPSLIGLIVRNPLLLPAELRPAFAADPARFLLTNRDALSALLPGVELPVTRSTEVGLRLQAAFSRMNLSGEVRYSSGEILARRQRDLLTTFSADLKLDAANSIQVSAARSFVFDGAASQTALTISYVHRFGAGSGGGLQFFKSLGLGRTSLQGRVFLDLNGNGQDDAGEPGLAGMKVELDGNHFLTTDTRGHFQFRGIGYGEHNVALVSEELGVRLRATGAAHRQLLLSPRESADVSFGVTNFGFAQGRIFNDLFLSGEMSGGDTPGVEGVRIILRPAATGSANAAKTMTETVRAGGMYEFRNLPPGSYVLEIDPASIPVDFRLPTQTSWPIVINPLQGSYMDIPLVAQRAISGIVFIDRDGNGLFDSKTDEVIKGARVMAGRAEAWTDPQGAYILRNLPAGKIKLCAYLPDGRKSQTAVIELGANPAFQKNVGLGINELLDKPNR
jgi:hypothetical protein